LNVLDAKVSDMTVRPLNDSLVRYSGPSKAFLALLKRAGTTQEVENAVAQKMVDIG
jgi:hypothetical protein